jgi:PIN domain nuclease of toxin-antitoxin system
MMHVLVDTQALLWFEAGDRRLSSIAKSAISDRDNIKSVSMASLWEIAIKLSIGKLELDVTFDDILSLSGYQHLAVESAHLRVVRNLPLHHRDPFDRLIIAQASHLHLPIVSSDEQFDSYGVKRIW